MAARPRSVDKSIVAASFVYTPAAVPAGGASGTGTLDITLTSANDPAIGRLRANFNVNLWASAALPNSLSIVNQACFTAGQLYFRLMNSTTSPVSPGALTFFLQQM
jgi:hypothetical protein